MRSSRSFPSPISHTAAKIARFLVPSPLATAKGAKGLGYRRKNVSTDYLDGTRGIASLIVMFAHFVQTTHPNLYFGYGQGPSGEKLLLQLPILRLIYAGNAMVAIFFVLSGYALSIKPLGRARDRQWEKLHRELSSSIFRRAGRLMLPAIASSFFAMVVGQLGGVEHDAAISIFSETKTVLRLSSTRLERLLRWISGVGSLISIWTWEFRLPDLQYGLNLWTLSVELRCSLVLYLFIMGTSRLRPRALQLVLGASMCYCMAYGRWDVCLFLAGMLLAHINLTTDGEHDSNFLPLSLSKTKEFSSSSFFNNITLLAILILGLFLASEPERNALDAPYFSSLNALIPNSIFLPNVVHRFWVAIGAILIIYVTSQVSTLKALLRARCVQYLGEISFALYLVHDTVNASVGHWLQNAAWSVMGTQTRMKYEMGFLMAMCVVIPLVFWVADVFWRGVDKPLVAFMNLLDGWCCEDETLEFEST
jgi:peptidoglycan/LPS O-acetylase OafA/YrhL